MLRPPVPTYSELLELLQSFELRILGPSLQAKKTPTVAYVANKQAKNKGSVIDQDTLKTFTLQKRGFQPAVDNPTLNTVPIDVVRPTTMHQGGQSSSPQDLNIMRDQTN